MQRGGGFALRPFPQETTMKKFLPPIVLASALACVAYPVLAAGSHTTPCYFDGKSLNIDSGCTLEVKSGGTLQADSGSTTSLSGPAVSGPAPVACGATCTLSTSNKGAYTLLNQAAGSVATLPAATGTGNTYKLLISVATTSAAEKVLTNPTTDVIIGTAQGENAGTAKVFVGNAGTYHSLQMPFTGSQPSGGFVGDSMDCTDIASGTWLCNIRYQAGTTPTTPYSASTS
jgi:hypothetical protein